MSPPRGHLGKVPPAPPLGTEPRKKYQRAAKLPTPTRSKVQPTGEELRVIHSRVEGFIRDDGGRYTLRHLMVEAYLQGMRDTLDCMEQRGNVQMPYVRDIISV